MFRNMLYVQSVFMRGGLYMFSHILAETNNLKIGQNFKQRLEGSARKEGGIIDR